MALALTRDTSETDSIIIIYLYESNSSVLEPFYSLFSVPFLIYFDIHFGMEISVVINLCLK